jgi:hypothetical protein
MSIRTRLEMNSNGLMAGRQPDAVHQRRLLHVEVPRGTPGPARHRALADLRLRGGLLGPAPHREDPGRPLRHRLLARLRPGADRSHRRGRVQLRRAVRQRLQPELGAGQVQGGALPRALRAEVGAAGGGRLQTTARGRAARTAPRPRPWSASRRTPSAAPRSTCGRSASRGRTPPTPTSRSGPRSSTTTSSPSGSRRSAGSIP